MDLNKEIDVLKTNWNCNQERLKGKLKEKDALIKYLERRVEYMEHQKTWPACNMPQDPSLPSMPATPVMNTPEAAE